MSDSKAPRVPPDPKPVDVPAVVRPGATGLTGRFERGGLGRPPSRPAGSGRHSAITRTLQNYATYKTWAEKMKSNWVPPKDPKP